MIKKVKHHFLLYPFFKLYIQGQLKRNFRQINIMGDANDEGKPVLALANHFSWWDGFFALHLNQKLFKRKFTFLMTEKELNKHWYFQFTGGISIRKGSKSMLESLRYCAELIDDPQYFMLVFPQGKFESMHQNKLQLEKGFDTILKNAKQTVHLLFVVNLIEYFSNSKPSVFIYFREYEYTNKTAAEILEAYQAFYSECKAKTRKLNHARGVTNTSE